ncbi:MAG: 1-acyl-sn-glycerol-3-phosphate acyltransferase [Firmicutes bacterium]|nr:1-acyl-sn-glycerol-3-phosphate acyltransferase [Bacillota bacterium]
MANGSGIDRVIYRTSVSIACRLTHKHIRWVGGLEYVPRSGPFILVANHSSFFDHFLTGVALNSVRQDKVYFLTKAESFTSPLKRRWHFSVGAIPIQRDKPDRDALEAIYKTLRSGHPLVVYPEGTRGPGWPLLPFKDGAFRFALKAGVPIIPAGLVGTATLLPKGAIRTHKASIGICFGQPLEIPQVSQRDEQLAQLRSVAEERITALMEKVSSAIAIGSPAPGLIEVANQMVDDMLDGEFKSTHIKKETLKNISKFVKLSKICNPGDIETEVVKLRIFGLETMMTPYPLRILRAHMLRRRALSVLDRDPNHPMARYVIGLWYLNMPKQFGQNLQKAIDNLSVAANTDEMSCRFHFSLATALIKMGKMDEADDILSQIIAIEQDDERSKRRIDRAIELRRSIYTGKAHIKLISDKVG